MRELFFRGKMISGGDWSYGDVVQDIGGEKHRVFIHNRISGVDKFNGDYMGSMVVLVEIDPNTSGQFIGTKDKAHNNIFEGDFILYEGWSDPSDSSPNMCIRSVEFRNGCFGLKQELPNTNDDLFDNEFVPIDIAMEELDFSRDCEVIGNIHDNPELLMESIVEGGK